MMTLLLFLLAFLLLTGGSELISRGTSSIARHPSISETMIGITIIAFSTSAPEFLVNIFSSIRVPGYLLRQYHRQQHLQPVCNNRNYRHFFPDLLKEIDNL